MGWRIHESIGNQMNVLIFDFDSTIPNLSAMRIYAYHAARGDHVELRRCCEGSGCQHHHDMENVEPRLGDPVWNLVYGSLIFERSKPLAERACVIYPEIILGGTGWDFENGVQIRRTDLPDEIAACAPDYAGYPGCDFSLGFAQRGCRLQCTHCVVPRKEGRPRSEATLEQIMRPDLPGPRRAKVVLLDNDFFGNPSWKDVIAYAKEHDIALAVIQGINCRTLSDEQAAAVASVRWMADDFSRRRVYTAWDYGDDERTFFRGMNRLVEHGIKPRTLMVYMLIGYEAGETHEERDHRRKKLREFGAMPYPMPYVRDGELGDELCAFQSWCIQRKDQLIPWEEWWGKAKGSVRKLGTRRVTLPLFREEST